MMNQEQELKAQIKQVDRNLLFYSSYWDLLVEQGDVLLDKRLSLTKELKG